MPARCGVLSIYSLIPLIPRSRPCLDKGRKQAQFISLRPASYNGLSEWTDELPERELV